MKSLVKSLSLWTPYGDLRQDRLLLAVLVVLVALLGVSIVQLVVP